MKNPLALSVLALNLTACAIAHNEAATASDDQAVQQSYEYYLAESAKVVTTLADAAQNQKIDVTFMRHAGDKFLKILTKTAEEGADSGANIGYSLVVGVLLARPTRHSDIGIPSETQETKTAQITPPNDSLVGFKMLQNKANPADSSVAVGTTQYFLASNVKTESTTHDAVSNGKIKISYLRPAGSTAVGAIAETIDENKLSHPESSIGHGFKVVVTGVMLRQEKTGDISPPSEAQEEIETAFPIPFGTLQGFRTVSRN